MPKEVLFGAAISVISLLLGSLLTYLTSGAQHRRQQSAEKSKRRAEKFEELISILFQHKHWIYTIRDIRLYDYDGELTISPMAKAQAIVVVYFPQFRATIDKLDLIADEVEVWMIERQKQRLAGADLKKVTEGMLDTYHPYSKVFFELVGKLHRFGETEFR
jgi:hypothetical protein